MPSSDEITLWIGSLGAGDERAAEALWSAYFEKLTRLARQKLESNLRRTADEEDVALSAMHSFCRGMQAGRYPHLADRDELWRLLVTIVAHKVSRQRRHERRLKRGAGEVRGESAFMARPGDSTRDGIGQVLGAEPTPELAVMVAESCEQMLVKLDDEALRQIASDRLAGFSNDEIADRLGCTTRSVERKLNRIRRIWTDLGMA